MAKEIRFGELVKSAGTPEVVSLWSDPGEDRSFMKAVRENRVLTLIQEPTSKRRDFGRIGFHKGPHASYLVFPKPLPRKECPRVIGIKYDLVRQARVADPIRLSDDRPAAKAKPPPQRRSRVWDVIIRRTAKIESLVTIDRARNLSDAKRQALRRIKEERFDLSRSVQREEVLSVDERKA